MFLCPTPWRRWWHPTPVLLPGKSHGQRSLVGCSPRGREESDTTEATEQQQRQQPHTLCEGCLCCHCPNVRLHYQVCEIEMAPTQSRYIAWRKVLSSSLADAVLKFVLLLIFQEGELECPWWLFWAFTECALELVLCVKGDRGCRGYRMSKEINGSCKRCVMKVWTLGVADG